MKAAQSLIDLALVDPALRARAVASWTAARPCRRLRIWWRHI